MVLKQLRAPQQPGDHHAHDDGRDDHADVVDEGVHHVEVRQARAGGEQDEGQDGGRDADDERGLLRRQVELLPHAGGDHLDDRDEGGQPRHGEGGEEEHPEERASGHLGDDGGEGDEGQGGPGDLHLADPDVLRVRHEAEGREDADPCEQLEGGVGEARHEAGSHQVGAAPLEVGGVGEHDAEAHGQGEEDLPEGRHPHLVVQQGGPLGREQGIEPLPRAREQEGAHHEAGEHDDQQRQEDLVGLLHASTHAQGGHHQAEAPYEQQRQGHAHDD